MINKPFISLLSLEIKKLVKYKIIHFSFAISLLMGIIVYYSEDTAIQIYSTLLFTDVVLMGMMFVISSLFFERQESILKTLIVSPVSNTQILFSKIFSSLIIGLISVILITSGLFMNLGSIDLSIINLFILLPSVFVTIFFHSCLGIVLTYYSKDFNSALINYSIYSIIFVVPPLVLSVIPDVPKFINYLYKLSPSDASSYLFTSSTNNFILWELIFSFIYLILLGILCFKFIVLPKFEAYVGRGD